jgi:hypothetical protein
MSNARTLAALALLLFAPMLRAQEISTAIVPVVGSVFGAGMARWRTDVEITNDTSTDADVALELPATATAPIFFTLTPGQTQRFSDVVAEAFGLDAALSPLRITTGNRRGLRVRATAYAVNNGNTSTPQRIEVYPANTYFPVRVLDGLAFSDAYRTNIGLVNFGDTPADFLLALQRIPGRNLAVSNIRVAPGAIVHSAIQALFPLITSGGGFSVVVETSARDTHVYASVVESATSTATFIVPRVGAR